MKLNRILAVGATLFAVGLPVTVRANQPTVAASFAILSAFLPAPNPATDESTNVEQPVAAAAAAAGAPNLELTKKCPTLRYIGRDAALEIVLTNRGNGPAQNVVVTDNLPAGVEFLNADNNGQREGGNIVWRVGTLDAGQSKTFTINVRCNQIATVRNTATVTYCAESRAACEFPVKGIPAILLEMGDDPDPIEIGNSTTYTIVVTNQGTAVDTNINVTAIIPAEEDYASSDGVTKGKIEGRTLTFAPLATLAPKAKATWKVVVKGNKEADVRFKVVLKSDATGDVPVEKTESTHIY